MNTKGYLALIVALALMVGGIVGEAEAGDKTKKLKGEFSGTSLTSRYDEVPDDGKPGRLVYSSRKDKLGQNHQPEPLGTSLY